MSLGVTPTQQPLISDQDGFPTFPWISFFDAISRGDPGLAWAPTIANLTIVGGIPTAAGRVYQLSQYLAAFVIRIVPAQGGSTSGVAGTTAITNFPLKMSGDGFCAAVSGLLGTVTGMCDSASNFIFPPGLEYGHGPSHHYRFRGGFMIKFDFVSIHEIAEEFQNYIEANKADLKKYASQSLDIDYQSYLIAAHSGQLAAVILRHDGRLCGFSLFAVASDLRDRNIFEAQNHGLYVEKSYRAKYGSRMIEAGEKFMRSRGVLKTTYINDSKAFGRMMEKMGYKPTYTVWSKSYE